MPKVGMQPVRRQSLINAAISLIGEAGSLDVPVKNIAVRAGMSPALAFHYFDGKDGIILETMRHLLREYSNEIRDALKRAGSPQARIDAIISTSFGASQFDRNTVAAWLVFYLKSYSSPPAARLLAVYTARLRSNLMHALCSLAPRAEAERLAESLASLIDGIYIRQTLRPGGPDAKEAIALCRQHMSSALATMAANQR